jgi:1,4-alpha-glucan branching enzyme
VAFDGGGEIPSPANELVKDPATGRWTGFFPGVLDGARYRYWVEGPGGKGLKRHPWARELEFGNFHDTDCIVRDRNSYPWHDQGFVEPAPADLVVYQFHVGVFSARGIRPALTLAAWCHRPL